MASTVGYAAAADEPPHAVAAEHLAALERLGENELDCYVSVKLAPLGWDRGLFSGLVEAAARAGRRLHLDALAPETVDATWALLEEGAGTADLGTTVPGRWRRSADDAERAAELGLAVRVVKGQWPDPDGAEDDPRSGFLRVVEPLRGARSQVALATHDVRLLEEALRRLGDDGPRTVELFLGLPFAGPAAAAARTGVAVRLYVPYGSSGAPYPAAAIARSPSAVGWLVQDLLHGKEKTWRALRRRSRPS